VELNVFLKQAMEICDYPNTDQPFMCLDLTFIYVLLRDGFGLEPSTKLHLYKKINGHELSWALGAAFNVLQNGLWRCFILLLETSFIPDLYIEKTRRRNTQLRKKECEKIVLLKFNTFGIKTSVFDKPFDRRSPHNCLIVQAILISLLRFKVKQYWMYISKEGDIYIYTSIIYFYLRYYLILKRKTYRRTFVSLKDF